MAITKCICPECGLNIKLNKPIESGKTVICPECNERFWVGEKAASTQSGSKSHRMTKVPASGKKTQRSDDDEEDAPRKKRKATMKADRDDDEEDEDDPRPSKSGKRKKIQKQSNPTMKWVLVGVLLVLASGALIYGLTSKKKEGDGNGTPDNPSPIASIELSQPEASLNLRVKDRLIVTVIDWKVHYKITNGHPPSALYRCTASSSVGMQSVDLSLEREGTITYSGPLTGFSGHPNALEFTIGPKDGSGSNYHVTKTSCKVTRSPELNEKKTNSTQEEVVKKITSAGGSIIRSAEKNDGAPVTVTLNRINLSDIGADEVSKLVNLITLLMTSSGTTDDDLAQLKVLKNLRILTLNDNPRITDNGIRHLMEMTNLELLILSDTEITDDALEMIKKLKKLRMLEIGCQKITDEGLKHLKELPELQSLNLNRSEVSDQGLVHIGALKGLKELKLDGSKISDTGLEHLKPLTNLQVLHVTDTRVTDEGIRKLKVLLPDLTIVN